MLLPDGTGAHKTAGDYRFYLSGNETENRPLEDETIVYLSSDAMPFSMAGFETEVALSRVSALYRLSEAAPPRTLIVGADALSRKVMPRSALQRTAFSIRAGEEIDRDILLELLVSAGYSRAPLVEEVGDFSARGFIVDIYPPLYPYPVRVEQMGDRVDSIRFFDPTNQRSKAEVAEVRVGPLHMVVPDDKAREVGLEKLKDVCDDRGIEKRVRQRLLDDLRHGVRFPGAELFLPYFFPKPETLFDYLPQRTTFIVPDEHALGRALEDLEEEIKRGWEAAAEDGFPVPAPDELYLMKDELVQRINRFRTVVMSDLETESPDRIGIRISCESNTDIRPSLLQSKAYDQGMAGLVNRLQSWRDDGIEVFLVSHTNSQANRLMRLLEPYTLNLDFRGTGFEPSNLVQEPTPGIRLYVGALSSGFRMPQAGRIIVTEEEIFGSRVRTSAPRRAIGSLISSLTDLAEGDAVVHEDYGIGIFRGLTKKEFEGINSEVMTIEYAGGDLLYHPLERLQVIQKYVSGSDVPRIDRLGGTAWAKTKAKVKKSIREMAKELLDIYAKRQVSTRSSYSPPDETFAAFEASFEFEETPDQAKAITDVMKAMDSDKPMDVLVCGDVGYGKTEVALRAAFRCIMDGKQAAILVPTTVLAQQHFDTCTRRFKDYPITVDVLSRFRSTAEQKGVAKELSEGKLDLVIGTHRLLQKDVIFKNLGMLVVDEEHRFGVAHKEKIKKFKAHVDVLTLTATPIPRTLNLSMSGIRDLSVIETPPENRRSIRTHVVRESSDVVRDALHREIARGGQAFYLHNRVRSIHKKAAALKRIVPEGEFRVAHGQMPAKELEEVMLSFVRGEFNVLVCTSIIESGLDIPRANTIIIERADTFGLADLYQLRGRVGRSNVRAYAYLLTPSETLMTPDAVKRLAVIQEHSSLGQGFRIAMRDLEIRGAGNILGTSQSGHVAAVGYEMYMELMEAAVREIKGEEPAQKIDPETRLKVEALIPEDHVPDARQRMNLYKRLSQAESRSEIEEIEAEMADLYGNPPQELSNLIDVMRVRLGMKQLMISRLDFNGKGLVAMLDPATPVEPSFVIDWAAREPDTVKFLGQDRIFYRTGKADAKQRLKASFKLLSTLKQAIHGRTELTDEN